LIGYPGRVSLARISRRGHPVVRGIESRKFHPRTALTGLNLALSIKQGDLAQWCARHQFDWCIAFNCPLRGCNFVPNKGPMSSAIAYVRISSKDKPEDEVGIDAQLAQIREFAEANGYQIAKTFRDHSSELGNPLPQTRPGLYLAIRNAKKESVQ
jgi:hypothetical protein